MRAAARIAAACMAIATPVAAAAEPTVADLAKFFDASQRLAAGEPVDETTRYRAGFYAGYLAAVRERLAVAGEVCPMECRCEVDAALERALMDKPPPGAAAGGLVEEVVRRVESCHRGEARGRSH